MKNKNPKLRNPYKIGLNAPEKNLSSFSRSSYTDANGNMFLSSGLKELGYSNLFDFSNLTACNAYPTKQALLEDMVLYAIIDTNNGGQLISEVNENYLEFSGGGNVGSDGDTPMPEGCDSYLAKYHGYGNSGQTVEQANPKGITSITGEIDQPFQDFDYTGNILETTYGSHTVGFFLKMYPRAWTVGQNAWLFGYTNTSDGKKRYGAVSVPSSSSTFGMYFQRVDEAGHWLDEGSRRIDYNTVYTSSDSFIPDLEWHHYVFSFDTENKTIKCYRDFVLVETIADTFNSAWATPFIPVPSSSAYGRFTINGNGSGDNSASWQHFFLKKGTITEEEVSLLNASYSYVRAVGTGTKYVQFNGPRNVYTEEGALATLDLDAVIRGTTPYSYQWYEENGTEIPGATSKAYTFQVPAGHGDKKYYCQVYENGVATKRSRSALVSAKQTMLYPANTGFKDTITNALSSQTNWLHAPLYYNDNPKSLLGTMGSTLGGWNTGNANFRGYSPLNDGKDACGFWGWSSRASDHLYTTADLDSVLGSWYENGFTWGFTARELWQYQDSSYGGPGRNVNGSIGYPAFCTIMPMTNTAVSPRPSNNRNACAIQFAGYFKRASVTYIEEGSNAWDIPVDSWPGGPNGLGDGGPGLLMTYPDDWQGTVYGNNIDWYTYPMAPDGGWHNYCVTWNRSGVKIYRDAVLVANVPLPSEARSDPGADWRLYIGDSSSLYTYGDQGVMNCMHYWASDYIDDPLPMLKEFQTAYEANKVGRSYTRTQAPKVLYTASGEFSTTVGEADFNRRRAYTLNINSGTFQYATRDWVPEDLAVAPKSWYDFNDGVTLSGSDITEVTNKGASAYTLTPTETPPTYTATQNGLNVASFSGTSQSLSEVGNVDVDTKDVYGVLSWANTGGTYRHLYASSGYFHAHSDGSRILSSTYGNTVAFNAAGWLNGSPATSFGRIPRTVGFHMLSMQATGVTSWLGIAGIDSNASRRFIGDYAEHFTFDYTLSLEDRQKLEGYLAWKWGIQNNLPVDHPYKDSPPEEVGSIADLVVN